jgi:hypothetical protein
MTYEDSKKKVFDLNKKGGLIGIKVDGEEEYSDGPRLQKIKGFCRQTIRIIEEIAGKESVSAAFAKDYGNIERLTPVRFSQFLKVFNSFTKRYLDDEYPGKILYRNGEHNFW